MMRYSTSSSFHYRSRMHALRSVILLAAFSSTVSSTLAAQNVSAPREIARVSLGVLGMPVGFLAGGLLTRSIARSIGQTDDAASTSAMIGAYAGAALTTAIGPTIL